MKPFLVLLISLVLIGCGSDSSPDAAVTSKSGGGVKDVWDDESAFSLGDLHGVFASKTTTDVQLEKLQSMLPPPEFLSLTGTPITDAGLVHLKELASLKTLWLGNTQITDAGLEHLKGLTSLRRLDLHGTKISGAGKAEIKAALPDCSLAAGQPKTAVTSKSKEDVVAAIQKLGGTVAQKGDDGPVFAIKLNNTPITDAGLERLNGLTSLTELSLTGTPITDAGLEHLKGLTSLKTLRLSYTGITNAGLEHLEGLTSLTELKLTRTQITDAGLADIKAALPDCDVIGP